MILVDLEITDYKQFAGTHRFTPTPNGVVAVIGTNGAGKTTLFEAIEWCLFQPREIANAEVPPRGGSGSAKVVLTLHDPRTAETYTVTRRLTKSGQGQAEVARGDGDAREILVTGTRPVSEYVWRSLIGLDHRAFVATFFTRQKELSFFGNSRPTERRREVQRLLGLETIRKAQETLLEERRAAHNQAEALLLQVVETAQSRDFEAELAEATAGVATSQRTVAEHRAQVHAAELVHQKAQRAVDEQTDRERQDTVFAAELARLTREMDHAARAVEAAEAEIARLTALAATRDDVQRLAATADAARSRVDALEVLRAQHERLAQASREVETARGQLAADLTDIRRLVSTSPYGAMPTWIWPQDADSQPLPAIDRLLETASSLSVEVRERRVVLLDTARDQHRQVTDAEVEAERIRAKLAGLEAERDALFSDGDPDDEIAEVDRRERLLDTEVERHATTIRLMSESIADLRGLAERLAKADPDALCPSCGRPFTEHDARSSQAHARARIEEHESHVADLKAEVVTLTTRRAELGKTKAASRSRQTAIQAIEAQIGKGQGALSGQEETLARLRVTASASLASLGATDPPSDDEIANERRCLAAERAVNEAAGAIRGRRAAVAGHLARIDAGEATRREIGEVAYDPAALAAARSELQEATKAGARLAEIDRQLARMPEHLAARDSSVAARLTAETAHNETTMRRTTLEFDPANLAEAKYALEDAVEDERNARSRLTAAEVEQQAATGRVQQVERDREAHRALAKRADDRARERDVLDEMVKEFNQFDRFVTQRVRPQMEDLTSELVRIVTDDKYTEVTLDDDYGVHVRDGVEGLEGDVDRFPLEQFSGGERDVVSLCARLSLSRIIGAQAVNPPRFLVLDEVFGSLDRERRLNLLEMLSNLAGSADVFQQLFVISHLDDVRTSPAFNEVWRVVEQGDGTSRLENLNQTGGAEEL